MNGRLLATESTVGALDKVEALPLHREGIEGEKAVGEQIAHVSKIFDTLGGLNGAQHAGDRAEHAYGGAGLYVFLGGRLGKQATVAGGAGHVSHQLSAIATDTAHGKGFPQEHTGIVDQVFRGEIVGAVDDEVVGTYQLEGVGLTEIGLVGLDLDMI